MRHYWSWEEEQCYEKGRKDEEYHRHNWEHDRWSEKPCDKAYYDGREDFAREERRREEERQMERMEEERQERLHYERQQEEEAYYRAIEEQAYYEQQEDDNQSIIDIEPNDGQE